MKLQPDRSDAPTITSHGPGWIAVDGERIEHSVIVASDGQRIDWNATRYEHLEPSHFETLAKLDIEVVIFGSGSRIRFPRPAWIAPLASRRIGIETMDTAAACRTYNILAQEGRRVAAALLLEPVA
ncbi:Mth938-like domain-containing protein [Ramlibacter sp. AW1]|uniref:Mth938-like domain-containing protein n=1 Tax=Ramlibacter aurantiacus TaxID=2801330 RepID=A0A936ZNE3_9BURK|nr:Mth938-like domain-containing protein [Ramlibacter aurantiacus]MBL0419426.1 Mth938-like domain-containing protein [Ramlibacter aurantiacus]